MVDEDEEAAKQTCSEYTCNDVILSQKALRISTGDSVIHSAGSS